MSEVMRSMNDPRVFELAVIHQPAHRRIGSSGYFNQVNIKLTRHAESFHKADDTQRLVLRTREANLWSHDFTVQTVFTFFALAAVTKFSSDDSILHNICYTNCSGCCA